MSELPKYTFKINDYSPETLPFRRLLAYYNEITRLFDTDDGVHLVDVVESSHGSQFAIARNHETKILKRFGQIAEGTAPKKAMNASERIDAMLCEDQTSGAFVGPQGNNVIAFPGKTKRDGAVVNFRDAATFYGELYHISGTQDDAKIRLHTDVYGVVFCATSREIAKSLRDFLFEDVRVSGRGMWTRRTDGKWDIDDFSITDFAPVSPSSLREEVNKIRSMSIDVPADAMDQLSKLNEEGGLPH